MAVAEDGARLGKGGGFSDLEFAVASQAGLVAPDTPVVTTVHEQLVLDVAVAHAWLEDRGFERIYPIGTSGGASLYCLYLQQAGRAPHAGR